MNAEAAKQWTKNVAKQAAASPAEAKQEKPKEEVTQQAKSRATPVKATKVRRRCTDPASRRRQRPTPPRALGSLSCTAAAPPHQRSTGRLEASGESPRDRRAYGPYVPSHPSQPGEEPRFEHPRPHRHRRPLQRRLHPAHDEAQCGEHAGGGQPPRRVPAAVAAGAPGLQLPSRRQPRSPTRRRRSPIRRRRDAADEAAHGSHGCGRW